MEYIYHVMLDTTPMSKKPTNGETKIISNRITLFTGLTETEMVRYTQPPYSYTFVPAEIKGKRCSANWVRQNLFVLDFDGGIMPQEVIDRLWDYGITPNIIYYTFSDTPERRKFRVLILVDKVITDPKEAEFYRRGLMIVFPEADKSCKDAARMFFGGIKSEKLSSSPTELTKLSELINIKIITNDNGRTRNLEKNSNFYNINRNTPNSPKKANNNYSFSEPQKRAYLDTVKQNKFPFEQCLSNVKILQDFHRGVQLPHPQLFGLATSFISIKGGEKYMNQIMTFYNEKGKTDYDEDKFSIVKMVKYYDYFPERLSSYSPYEEDHKYTDLIDAGKTTRGFVEQLQVPQKITLVEAQDKFEQEYAKALAKNDKNIYIFAMPTGLGKTEKIKDATGVTICCATHKLKDQLSGRMSIDHFVVPELPIFESKETNSRIEYHYQLGLNDYVYQILKEVAFDFGNKYSLHDQNKAKSYLQLVKESYDTEKTVLTTHIRGTFDQHLHDTIIFDEDPVKDLLSLGQFKLSNLISLEHYSRQKETISKLIDYLRQCEPGKIAQAKDFGIDKAELAQTVSIVKPDGNVLQFFNAKWILKDKKNPDVIHYMIERQLPTDKKIMIMSATAHVNIYTALYGDRVKVIDLSLVENRGEVLQHSKKSFSRSSMAYTDLSKVEAIIGDKKVITFMKFKSRIINAHQFIHFGNCEGYDDLKGQDLVVLGTPHKNEIQYMLYAKATGIDVNAIDTGMAEQKIDWKGFRFLFMCYGNEQLREIQLGLIEADLIQAVGRARTLRTDATVIVLSNLPLMIADKIIFG